MLIEDNMEKIITVLKDTKIIQENTADSLAIEIKETTPIVGDYENNGQVIKGTNLTVTNTSHLYLGNLKTRLSEIDAKIAELAASKATLEAQIAELQPVVDQAVVEILKDPESVDERGK